MKHPFPTIFKYSGAFLPAEMPRSPLRFPFLQSAAYVRIHTDKKITSNYLDVIFFYPIRDYMSANSAPALNLTTFLAGIVIVLPV